MSLHEKANTVVSQAMSQINKQEKLLLWLSLNYMMKEPKDMFYCTHDLSEDDAKFLAKTLVEVSKFRAIRQMMVFHCYWTVLGLHSVILKESIFANLEQIHLNRIFENEEAFGLLG